MLLSTYQVAKEDWWKKDKFTSTRQWLSAIAERSGLEHPDLVSIHEANLINKSLLTRREYGDGSGITVGSYFRLTPLGFAIGDFISHYEPMAPTAAA